MVEGQEDVTWDQWVALAHAAQEAGLEALFRSDHYGSVMGRIERGSLDAWTTLAGLASITQGIRLGTLVSPVTFRHPSVLAKGAATVDHISGGRVELGIGAGWNEQEHRAYGFPFPDTRTRIEMLEEQIEIVARSWGEDSFTFEGKHYSLADLDAHPKPIQRPRPNLLVGGSGGSASVRIAARWADEYNTLFASVEECAKRRRDLDAAWESAGRDAHPVLSMMTTCLLGRTDSEVEERAGALLRQTGRDMGVAEWLDGAREERLVGTVSEVATKIEALSEVGVERLMLQHLVHDDIEMVSLMGELV
jgi:F420-dependent oxidoreductase-like protein